MTKHTGNTHVRHTTKAHGTAGGKPGGLTPNQGDFFGDIHAIYEAVSKRIPAPAHVCLSLTGTTL